jgi:RIO kinase 1
MVHDLSAVVLMNRAYPRLKDAVVEDDVYPVLYNQLLRDMWIMYHECRLIHADLSEFNLLYALLTLAI